MTIQSEISRVVHLGTGITKTFEIPFSFFDNEIAVYFDEETTAQQQGEDYTISNYENNIGGMVTFNTPPSKDVKIIIVRNVALTQLITFLEGEDFPAKDYENSLDKIIMALQQIKERMNHTFITPPGVAISQENFYELVKTVNQNLEFIKDLPNKLEEMKSLYDTFLNNISDTVQEGDKQPISSEGVWQYMNENGVKKYSNISVSTSAIQEDETYENYPYCAEINIAEAKSTHVPLVVFDMEAAESGDYAPLAEAKEGKICIYMKKKPTTETLIIPSLILQ